MRRCAANRGQPRPGIATDSDQLGSTCRGILEFGGDMVLDTDETSFAGSSNLFSSTIMHEVGHAFGLSHVRSNTDDLLMDPVVNTTIDGPQLDEVRGIQYFLLSEISSRATARELETTASCSRPCDCNGDGLVDAGDLACACASGLTELLTELDSAAGDLNLDGSVGFADFLVLSNNFGRAVGYAEGDLDCDGRVGFAEFLVLSNRFGVEIAVTSVAPVPEPSEHSRCLRALLGWVGLAMRRRAGRRLISLCFDRRSLS